MVPDIQKQANLRLAKTVDRLHRIADQEKGPAVSRCPAPRQRPEQGVLRLGRVLELIQQKVLKPPVNPQRKVAGRRLVAQCCPALCRDLRIIGLALAGKDQLEFSSGER